MGPHALSTTQSSLRFMSVHFVTKTLSFSSFPSRAAGRPPHSPSPAPLMASHGATPHAPPCREPAHELTLPPRTAEPHQSRLLAPPSLGTARSRRPAPCSRRIRLPRAVLSPDPVGAERGEERGRTRNGFFFWQNRWGERRMNLNAFK